MKYINRARMGIELFFDQLSDLTVASSTDTPEDCVEILQQQPYTAQMEECRRIQGALRRLMSARYALKEMLPARVQMVATSQFTPTPDRLLPVFQWVQELQKANAQARIQWQYALQDVGYRLGESAGAFLQAFSDLAAQRVSLLAQDDTLTLAIPDNLWGQGALQFTGVQTKLAQDSWFGYLFWIEADYADGVYEFRMLLDTDFSNTLYQERLLQSDDWTEITFRCTGASLELRTCDYAARIDALGIGGTDGVLLGLGELTRKQAMLGARALNSDESALFGLSTLMTALDLIPSAKLVRLPHELMDRLLDNRYLVEETCAILHEIPGKLSEKMIELLCDALDQYENEAYTRCERTMNRLQALFREARHSGDDLPWAVGVRQMLRNATAEYDGIFAFSAQYDDISAQIGANGVQLLHRAGFTGKFPNYTRKRGKWAEFVTFTTDGVPASTADGLVLLEYSVAVAKCELDKDGKIRGVSPEALNATAFDQFAENKAKFGLIFHPDQDGIRVAFPYAFTDSDTTRADRERTNAHIATGVAIALRSLAGKRLPRNYHPHCRGSLRAHHAFIDLLMRTLPVLSPVATATLLAQFLLDRAGFQMSAAIALAIAAGFGAIFVVTVCRYLHLRRTIWNR